MLSTVSPHQSVIEYLATVSPHQSVILYLATVSPHVCVILCLATVSPHQSVILYLATVSPHVCVILCLATVSPHQSVILCCQQYHHTSLLSSAWQQYHHKCLLSYARQQNRRTILSFVCIATMSLHEYVHRVFQDKMAPRSAMTTGRLSAPYRDTNHRVRNITSRYYPLCA